MITSKDPVLIQFCEKYGTDNPRDLITALKPLLSSTAQENLEDNDSDLEEQKQAEVNQVNMKYQFLAIITHRFSLNEQKEKENIRHRHDSSG